MNTRNVINFVAMIIGIVFGYQLTVNIVQPWLQERKERNVEIQGNKDYVKMEDYWKVIDVNYVNADMIVTVEGRFERRMNVTQRITSWYIPVKGEMWSLRVWNDKVVLWEKKDPNSW